MLTGLRVLLHIGSGDVGVWRAEDSMGVGRSEYNVRRFREGVVQQSCSKEPLWYRRLQGGEEIQGKGRHEGAEGHCLTGCQDGGCRLDETDARP